MFPFPRETHLRHLVLLATLSVTPTALQAQTAAVGTMTVQVEDVSPRHEFVGRVEAMDSVDLRSRIDGFIEKRLFDEGSVVEAGQPLFLIDARGLEIALDEARANLASAKASEADAVRRLERNRSLSQTVSRAVLEESQAARENAGAAVLSAEARVRQAELNLSYTRITSPLAGRIGGASLSAGSFVNASSPALARVVQMDPIRVVFSVSDRAVLDLRTAAGEISKDELARRFEPSLRLSNGQPYDRTGKIEFFGNEIDERTGTLAVRAQFANPALLLVPGQFVTVVIAETERKMRPVVPLGAVQQDREGRYVLLVDGDGKAALRRITVSEQANGNWTVDSGLEGGETLIVEGLANVTEGSPVEAHAVPDDDTDAAQ
ncbi:efflux RND transporter periplasmic adaptor subunit [Shinella zoogloeoides]|uniref:efflux RND transporter periplasmic adaptor subunit n=1 Tax=Shinella zoogloeoides TaxID=352475 RepID=UPI001F56FEB8|nr:efflux RND transporter periplasmic adaptor subunit [Shinella zoogloeoides]